jgi:hypothetical protein
MGAGVVPTHFCMLHILLQDLCRVLLTSLQQSSAQFHALTFEALTLGLWGLSSAHAELRDDIQGRTLGLQDMSAFFLWEPPRQGYWILTILYGQIWGR